MEVPAAPAGWDAPPVEQVEGRFWRYHWFETGATNGNPGHESRFRVNSPEASLHPTFGRRSEARANGLMQIRAEEDLFKLEGAEFYSEVWGGHPGTANKRVTVNGRSTYFLPRVGTEDEHCTYFYPSLSLKISDLVNGYNAFQWAVDQGNTFWGHMIVDNAALRVALTNGHPQVTALGLAGFEARVRAKPVAGREVFMLDLDLPSGLADLVAVVDYQGYYLGYDENGNLLRRDWHGFTKGRLPVGFIGRVAKAPFQVRWDTTMLPAQEHVAVRGLIRFKNVTNLVFLTAATAGLEIQERQGAKVFLVESHQLPAPFWSRASRKATCSLDLEVAPSHVERAELHIVTWTGGAGTAKEYFKLNGVFYPVAEGNRHELVYSRIAVEPGTLRQGRNTIELFSDTDHHGIEVMYPGPALVVRY